MKFFKLMKDGGPDSRVHGFFLVEIKKLFTIVILRFADGSREAYHSHAFNSISWVLWGKLNEFLLNGNKHTAYSPGIFPVITRRSTFHRVVSEKNTWVLSFRGPWVNTWQEFLPKLKQFITLTHGRKVVGE